MVIRASHEANEEEQRKDPSFSGNNLEFGFGFYVPRSHVSWLGNRQGEAHAL